MKDEKKKYRIPHRMFFTWFVPYPSVGSAVMGVLLPSATAILLTLCGVHAFLSQWSIPTLTAFTGVWMHGYHRRATLLSASLIAVGGWVLCRAMGFILFSEKTTWDQGVQSAVVALLGGIFGFALQRHQTKTFPKG